MEVMLLVKKKSHNFVNLSGQKGGTEAFEQLQFGDNKKKILVVQ